jgi:Zn-dependent peptidase ImmA (M78 family)
MGNRNRLLQAIGESRKRLENPYAYLGGDDAFDGVPVSRRIHQSSLHKGTPAAHARQLQILVWKDRHRLWPDGIPDDAVEILEPEVAARYLGIEIEMVSDLDAHGRERTPAGELDLSSRCIRVSDRASDISRRFTVAHELGHFLLHDRPVMQRDRALQRTREEVEADRFAAMYLMPAKLVMLRFRKQFDVGDRFALTDDTAYALSPSKYASIVRLRKSPRELARVLASAEEYRGVRMASLAAQFAVSIDAMANRILELELIELDR